MCAAICTRGAIPVRAMVDSHMDRLQRVRQQQKGEGKLADELDEIARHCAALPIVDSRKPAEMLYDEHGLPL